MTESPREHVSSDPGRGEQHFVDAPHINGGRYRTEQERAFILALDRCAAERGWKEMGCDIFDVDSSADITYGVDIVRTGDRCVTDSLRIDYHQGAVMVGEDETLQFVTPLDSAHPLFAIKRDGTPEEQAVFAADWLDVQLARIKAAIAPSDAAAIPRPTPPAAQPSFWQRLWRKKT